MGDSQATGTTTGTTTAALIFAGLGLLTSACFVLFGLVQLPIGIFLDRYGPRRIQRVLLFFAAAGAGLFAIADSLTLLVIGRALIGFGVSACLMAALRRQAGGNSVRRSFPVADRPVTVCGGTDRVGYTPLFLLWSSRIQHAAFLFGDWSAFQCVANRAGDNGAEHAEFHGRLRGTMGCRRDH